MRQAIRLGLFSEISWNLEPLYPLPTIALRSHRRHHFKKCFKPAAIASLNDCSYVLMPYIRDLGCRIETNLRLRRIVLPSGQ